MDNQIEDNIMNIPEFEVVSVNSWGGKFHVTFHWSHCAWTASGETVAECINKMVEHFTK